MRFLSLIFTAVLLLSTFSTFAANSSNRRFEQVKMDMWINGVENNFSKIPISFRSEEKREQDTRVSEELIFAIISLESKF